jgi:starch-binding outer membrane protein SusE/F
MKSLYKIFGVAMVAALGFTACDKANDVPTFDKGAASALTSSVATVAALPADSNNTVLTLNWTDPKYATDASKVKYVLEMDSTGKNFARAFSWTFTGTRTVSLLAKDLNNLLLGASFNYAFNIVCDMEFRITSSYGNNNEAYRSNVVRVKVTPYKIPPRVVPPVTSKLFIVGNGTNGGWNNPVPTPTQEFSRIDSVTYGGIFFLNANSDFLLLPLNGDWSTKFAIPNNGAPGITSAGSFQFYSSGGDNFKTPGTSGWYKITLDFQAGKYRIDPVTNALPQELYATGDATASSWTNNPPATQKFTRLNAVEYEITLPFVPGKFYKFLSSPGNWQPQFGGSSATGGSLGANYGGGGDPDAVPTPAAAGNYKVRVNFFSNTYKVNL